MRHAYGDTLHGKRKSDAAQTGEKGKKHHAVHNRRKSGHGTVMPRHTVRREPTMKPMRTALVWEGKRLKQAESARLKLMSPHRPPAMNVRSTGMLSCTTAERR